MAKAIVCTNCGAKFRAGMAKCPRCRTVVADPVAALAAAAASSRKLQKIAGGVGAVFVLVLAVLWLRQDRTPPAPVSPAKSADPMMSRRTQATRNKPETDGAPTAASERPFIEEAGKGYTAYASGDLASALAAYQAAVEKNPKDAEAWSNLGQVLVKLNRFPEALAAFDRAVEPDARRLA